MPLNKFVLLIVIVIGAAFVTIWVGTFVVAVYQIPIVGGVFVLPAALIGYVVWRGILSRWTGKKADD